MASLARVSLLGFNSGSGQKSRVAGSWFGSKYWYALADRGKNKAQLRFPDPLTLEWTLLSGECGVTRDFGVDSIEQMQFTP